MNKAFYKKLFQLAACWNLVAGCTGLLFYQFQFSLFFGDLAVMSNFHMGLVFRLFMLAVILFGLGYYMVSRNLDDNHGIVWIGGLGKLALFFTFTYCYAIDKVSIYALAAMFGDFLWAIAFALFLIKHRKLKS